MKVRVYRKLLENITGIKEDNRHEIAFITEETLQKWLETSKPNFRLEFARKLVQWNTYYIDSISNSSFKLQLRLWLSNFWHRYKYFKSKPFFNTLYVARF